MARRVVGLIGNGEGPTVHTEGKCTAVVQGLRPGGIVTVWINTPEESFVTEADGEIQIGRPTRVRFVAEKACQSLICNVLMEA